ncbi:hypothetical protein ACA910_011218 [Epithemia clementina (nom. ined.)]
MMMNSTNPNNSSSNNNKFVHRRRRREPFALVLQWKVVVLIMMILMAALPQSRIRQGGEGQGGVDFGIGFVLVADAKCAIFDNRKNALSLDHLPKDIIYESDTDKLYCMEKESCRNYIIRDCSMVHCRGMRSCYGTLFEQNELVSCRADEACSAMTVVSGYDVVCGGGYANVCSGAKIALSRFSLCSGQAACVSTGAYNNPQQQPPQQQQRPSVVKTNFYLGETGVLTCTNGNGHYTCQNLAIYIDNKSRACFGFGEDYYDGIGGCGVVCATKADCHVESIIFHHNNDK